MNDRTLDVHTVQRRLELIRSLLEDLQTAGPITEAQLETDSMLRHAVERILTQLVDTAVAINSHIVAMSTLRTPEDYRSTFFVLADIGVLSPQIAERLARSVGLRNILVHVYLDADLAIIAQSVELALRDYHLYVSAIAKYLLSCGPSSR